MLVLGDDTRSFLAIVRSLGRRGVAVHVAPQRFVSPALASRYIAKMHELPLWSDGEEPWLEAMRTLLAAERFELVIPCDETTLLPLARHRTTLSSLARLAIPHEGAIDVLFDKHATRLLAQSLGVPVPPGRLPQAGDTAEALAAAFGLPLMAKPRRSFRLDGLTRRRMVTSLGSVEALTAALPGLDPALDLVEGFVPGRGLGLSVLAHEGRILQVFQHQRVREDSSGSYYRVSVPVEPRYLGAVEAMAARLRYTGVAMFEFRADAASGAWVLLEVNARPWGSMPLAIHAGVDFPWLWYRLLTQGDEGVRVDYRVGLYGRNLLPDLRAMMREAGQRPGLTMIRLLELGRWIIGRERHDVLVFDDPRPGLREIGWLFESVSRHVFAAIPGLAGLRRLRERHRAAAALAHAGTNAPVLFLCQGNICRSPFAAAMFARAMAGSVAVTSGALQLRSGRPTPEIGQRVAARHGIDLSAHRSNALTAAMVREAALIVVFDRINLAWLAARFPQLATPVVMLGHVAGADEMEDPVDGDVAVFEATYARIAAWVGTLAALRGR